MRPIKEWHGWKLWPIIAFLTSGFLSQIKTTSALTAEVTGLKESVILLNRKVERTNDRLDNVILNSNRRMTRYGIGNKWWYGHDDKSLGD